MGRQVGNGECWTLAHDALELVQGSVQPRCMVSSGTIHGQCVYLREGGRTVRGDLRDVRTGDVAQYLECKFERRVNGRLVQSSSAGAPDHTSYSLPSPTNTESRPQNNIFFSVGRSFVDICL
jgi:myosin tail region-interacting protein MTI1